MNVRGKIRIRASSGNTCHGCWSGSNVPRIPRVSGRAVITGEEAGSSLALSRHFHPFTRLLSDLFPSSVWSRTYYNFLILHISNFFLTFTVFGFLYIFCFFLLNLNSLPTLYHFDNFSFLSDIQSIHSLHSVFQTAKVDFRATRSNNPT